MAYADFDYYKDTYCGSLIKTEDEFDKMIVEASLYLDSVTMGRITDDTVKDRVKLAACAVAEVCYNQYVSENEKEISSESVGPHSVSYVKKSKSFDDYQKEKMYKTKLYLATTGLLYCGVASCNL